MTIAICNSLLTYVAKCLIVYMANVQSRKVLWLWNSTVIHCITFMVPWLHGSLALQYQLFNWKTFVLPTIHGNCKTFLP